jgi:hypothetical protein
VLHLQTFFMRLVCQVALDIVYWLVMSTLNCTKVSKMLEKDDLCVGFLSMYKLIYKCDESTNEVLGIRKSCLPEPTNIDSYVNDGKRWKTDDATCPTHSLPLQLCAEKHEPLTVGHAGPLRI